MLSQEVDNLGVYKLQEGKKMHSVFRIFFKIFYYLPQVAANPDVYDFQIEGQT